VWQLVPFGVTSSKLSVWFFYQTLNQLMQHLPCSRGAGVSAAAGLLWQPGEVLVFLYPVDLQNEQLGYTGGKLLKELRSQRNAYQPIILS